MVAKIVTGRKLRGALQYNENKVTEGVAELILASGFAGDIEQMNFNQKLQRFQNLLMLKPSVKTNTLHISLNFDAAEKLTDENLQRIAITYMEKIGFGDQPFIAYRHHDAAHDHIHLLTTNIQANGKAISLHNIGCVHSERARKEIEEEFKLVRAESKQYKPESGIKPIDLEKVEYGRLPTKRAMSNTLNAVLNKYRFSSLPELNAVLKQFNMTAWRGVEDTPMFDKKGLVYSLLDEQGNRCGVPIKASAFYTKPTLVFLEQQFEIHRLNRTNDKPDLRKRIDNVMQKHPKNRTEFGAALKQQGIAVVFRESKDQLVYGMTFVDHLNKVVFNGSDLGKAYTASQLMEQLNRNRFLNKSMQEEPSKIKDQIQQPKGERSTDAFNHFPAIRSRLLDSMLKDTSNDHTGLKPRKKKRRKRFKI